MQVEISKHWHLRQKPVNQSGKYLHQVGGNHSFAVSDRYLYMGLSDHRLLALDRETGDTQMGIFRSGSQ
ncbi:MAG: hypothetical protein Ct9H300mP11_28780 [Chloroflexota bacterium]|nr:MAG: hypothetical protein Ct9H300mP11_28780 [Chloroflexota bacterium]